ncbi:MAG: hypothetical protein EZS28_025803, partial [Streblomastix strix]
MDGILMNLESISKDFDNISSNNPFGNFQSNFNPNQYLDDLCQIPSQDQQRFLYESDDNQIQRYKDHNSNDYVFGVADQIQLQVRGHRGRGNKSTGKFVDQITSPWVETRGDQSSQWDHKCRRLILSYKQVAGGSDYNFGSNMDIDIEQSMERDLTQTQPTTNDGPIVSTAPPQLGTASLHAEGETATQCAIGLGFQPLIGQEQEQSEDEPEQDQGQLDLNNLPDNPENESSLGLMQETRRSEANKGSIKPRSK